MRKKNKAFYLIVLVVCMCFLGGCGKEEGDYKNEDIKQEMEVDKIQEVEEKVEEIIPSNQNLLTGLTDLSEEAIGKRPVAVMVNNVNAALPQYGIAKADIIFEMHVEGDLTRLMAIYADYTQVPKVCAIRSCRYYFPVMSEGFDAIYIHWGIDPTMVDYIDALDVTRYDAITNGSGLFSRDQNRIDSGYSMEHTGYFDGQKLPEVLAAQGKRTELLDDKKGTAFLFNGLNEQIKPSKDICSIVEIDFGAAHAKFTYDEKTNTYLKEINGKQHIDGVEDVQLAFTNVFVLEADISVRTEYGHKYIAWDKASDSVGYYISNGAVKRIHWSKSSEQDYLKFFDENGEELSINRGKSYIAFNYAGQTSFK